MVRTITVVNEVMHVFGDLKARILDVDVTSYTTGGETLTEEDLGMLRVDILLPVTTEILLHEADWLPATDRFRIKLTSTGAELGAAANGGTFRVLVIGK
ncbi:MAG: hypothetical protein V3U45_03015 [bacterium]